MEPVYQFEFTHIPEEENEYKSPLIISKPLKSLSRNLKDSLVQLNTSHMVEQAFQRVQHFTEKKMEDLDPIKKRQADNRKKNRIQTFESVFNKM